jgi:hypothetical protein
VSTTQAALATPCASPTQTDQKACAYATQSYTVPTGVDNAFLSTTADLSGYGAGTCRIYKFNPPTTNPTNSAYSRRLLTTPNERVRSVVTRYYGTHTFGSLCSGTGSTPSQWPGYFVKFDAGTSAATTTAEAGGGSPTTSTATAGTIYVWNGSGTTSFTVPTSGTWSTAPATVNFTTNSNYHYDISASMASGPTYTTSSTTVGNSATAVVGAPVVGTITYKLTNNSTGQVLIDVTVTVDLGTLTSATTYTPAA